jgi:hypothetical protein
VRLLRLLLRLFLRLQRLLLRLPILNVLLLRLLRLEL